MKPSEKKALDRFAADVRRHYGDRLLGMYVFDYLFGEGDDDEISVDADVAVILADGEWGFLDTKEELVQFSYEILLDSEFYIRAWPLPASAWRDPSTYSNPGLVTLIKRHSEPIMEAA